MEILSVGNELVVGDHSLSGVEEGVADNLADSGVVWALDRDVTLNALGNRDVYWHRDDLLEGNVDVHLVRSLHRDVHLVRLGHGAVDNDFIWCVNGDVDRNIVRHVNMTRHLNLALDDHFAGNRDRDVARDGHVTDLPDGHGDRHIDGHVDEHLPVDGVDDRDVTDDGLGLDLGNLYVFNLLDMAFLDLRNLDNLLDCLHDGNFTDDLLDLMLDDMLNSFLDLDLWDLDYALDGLDLGDFHNPLLVFDARNFDDSLLDLDLGHVAHDLLRLDLGDLDDALLDLHLRHFDDLLLDNRNMTMNDTLLHDGLNRDRVHVGNRMGAMHVLHVLVHVTHRRDVLHGL